MPGRANFGFVAKYVKGKSTGNLEFQYQAGDINLKSTEISWLVVSSSKAHFKGTCTVNGNPDYSFHVKAKDNGEPGDKDYFSIKIWDNGDLYHSSRNILSDGNIMIRTKNK